MTQTELELRALLDVTRNSRTELAGIQHQHHQVLADIQAGHLGRAQRRLQTTHSALADQQRRANTVEQLTAQFLA